ncbi:MAG: ribosome maturation factor RimM [Coriobacteriales bacterium]
MSGTPYETIAQVVKTRGLEGKVLVRCTEGLPFCIYEGLELWVVPPLLEGVRRTAVCSLESCGDDSAVIGLEGLDSIDQAEGLVGRYLLARAEDLELDPQEDMVLVLGCRAVSDDGRELGRVTEYLETKANDVLVITREDGSELLVPVIEETVVAVPEHDSEPLVLHLLEGLEEL